MILQKPVNLLFLIKDCIYQLIASLGSISLYIYLNVTFKNGTNFGEFKNFANLSARKKTNEVQNPRRMLLCTVPVRVRGNWPHLVCSSKVVLSVLTTIRVSGISRC